MSERKAQRGVKLRRQRPSATRKQKMVWWWCDEESLAGGWVRGQWCRAAAAFVAAAAAVKRAARTDAAVTPQTVCAPPMQTPSGDPSASNRCARVALHIRNKYPTKPSHPGILNAVSETHTCTNPIHASAAAEAALKIRITEKRNHRPILSSAPHEKPSKCLISSAVHSWLSVEVPSIGTGYSTLV